MSSCRERSVTNPAAAAWAAPSRAVTVAGVRVQASSNGNGFSGTLGYRDSANNARTWAARRTSALI